MSGEVYVYGLIRAADAAVAAARIEGQAPLPGFAPPEIRPLGPVAALVSPAGAAGPPAEILPVRRNMLAHARMLEAALPAGPLLPVVFGLVSPGAAALAAALAPREAELTAALDRLVGRAEYGVHVQGDRDGALAAIAAEMPDLAAGLRGSGGAAGHYARIEIGRRVAEALGRRRDAAGAELLAALLREAEDHVLKAPEEDTDLLRAVFLLEMDREAAFAARLEAAAAGLAFAPTARARIRLIGPAPASHFVSIRLDTGTLAPCPAPAG